MIHSSIKLPQGKGKQWGVYWDKPEETVRTGHDQQSCGGWGEGYFTKDGTITTINHSSRWISFGFRINNQDATASNLLNCPHPSYPSEVNPHNGFESWYPSCPHKWLAEKARN